MADSGNPPPPPNAPVQGKKTAKQGMDYLQYMIKYFKSCGFVLPIWVMGYFNFSPSWVLLGLFAYLMGEEYRKVKESKLLMARQSVLNEKEAILARTEDLPSWVFFPDVERAEWLNKMLKQMWPYIGEYAKDLLKKSVEPAVQNSLPNSLKPFKFETIDLGDIPPRIGGVKVYIENVKRDEIILDFELFYASDSQIKVAVRGITAGIKDLTIHGHMRVVMRPLVHVMPIIGGLQVFFLNQPTVDFDLTNTANMLDVPLLSNTVRGIIVDQLSYYMVLPNKLPVQLASGIDMTAFKYPQPAGVVRLHVVAARELKKADFKVVGKGKSDPYCKIYIGAKTFKTKVIENTIAPTWNAYFEAVVDQSKGQFVDIDVLDQDPGDDDELGSCSVDIENVANNGTMDSWLPLENVKTGMLHVRALWLHPSKDPKDLDKAEKFNKEQGARSGAMGADDHLSSAILMVTLDSAKDLPRSKKSMSEPSPMVKLSIGNVVEKSIPKTKTTDPRWENNFHFLINDPNNQELNIEVIDSNKDKKLGTRVIKLRNILIAPDMTVNRPYDLKESGPNSKINLRLCLRVLTSEKPAAWARDDLPVRQASVPESGTSVDTGTGDDPAAEAPPVENIPASKPGSSPTKPAPQKPAPQKPAPQKPAPQSTQPASTQKTDAAQSKPASLPAKSTSPPPSAAAGSPTKSAGGVDDVSMASTIPEQKSATLPAGTAGTELRHRGGTPSNGAPGGPSLGSIQLTIRYSEQRQKLTLVVHRCQNLVGLDDDNMSDPYVRIYLSDKKDSKRKTQTIKNDLNPTYDETFEWGVTLSEASLSTLDIMVKNKNSMFSSAKVEMGVVCINLSQLELTKAHTDWYDLNDPEAPPKQIMARSTTA